MAGLRVYDSTKDGHQHLRGQIAQTVSPNPMPFLLVFLHTIS